jgi:hypothetical protein
MVHSSVGVILTRGMALQTPISELSYNGRNAPMAGMSKADEG